MKQDEEAPEVKLEDLITVKEAAEKLHISPQTLRNWVCGKRITSYKVGKKSMFFPPDLEDVKRRVPRIENTVKVERVEAVL